MINPMHFLDPQFLMGLIEERQDFGNERAKYIGEGLLPRKNFPEQTLVWETQRRENRLAGIYSAKGKAVPGDEIGFKTYFENVVWIKAAKYLDPDIVSKIRAPGMVSIYDQPGDAPFPIQGMADRVTSKVREYLQFIDDQVAAQEEYMRIKALTNDFVWPPVAADGTVISTPMPEWNAEGGKLIVTWPFYSKFVQNIWELDGVPASPGGTNRAGTLKAWNDTDADPRYDIEVIADMMLEERGVDVDGAVAIISRKALSYMAHLASIQRWLVGTNYTQNGIQFADPNRVKETIKSTFGLEFKLYDAKWTYLDGLNADGSEKVSSVRFMPANKMVIIPKGEKVGVLAQAPHETQQGQYVHGKTVYIKRQDVEPYEREMGISNVCWPLLQDPEGIGVFNLW